jgi:hypothetical protein
MSAAAAEADPFVLTMQEVGSNVVATRSGKIDLTGLNGGDFGNGGGALNPSAGLWRMGSFGPIDAFGFVGNISGPTSFGSGGLSGPNTSSGSTVPHGYGPIAGAGLPGLILACSALLALARRRRQLVA